MDKFLQLCFKIGKWASSAILALLFVIGVCLSWFILVKTVPLGGRNIDYKMDKTNVLTALGVPSANKDNEKTSKTKTKKDNQEEYKKIIEKVVKGTDLADQLSAEKMAAYVDKYVDKKDAKAFIKHFPAYYNATVEAVIKRLKENNPNLVEDKLRDDLKKNNILGETWDIYRRQYDEQVESMNTKKEQNKASRLVGVYAFLITLAVFVIMLFFPILIKIEENTRK